MTDNLDNKLNNSSDYVLQLNNKDYPITTKVVYNNLNKLSTQMIAVTKENLVYNKRENERYNANLYASVIKDNNSSPSIISDISITGFAFISLKEYMEGENILLSIFVENNKILELNCKIILLWNKNK